MSAVTDEDAVLVNAFIESHRVDDFERLIARYQDMVFRVAVSVLGPGSERDAEDVAQDVFLQIYRGLASFERRSKFSTWLYRIAYNRAIDRRRSIHSRRDAGELATEPEAPATDHDPIRARAVADCLSRLPDAQRAAIHLHYWLGHTTQEIAATLGVRNGTVKTWMFRARHLIARCLASKGVRP